ncbi:MAG: amino acid ABC transporter permease [Acetobacteraceae bacterium]|nr:amino acid ABC transporter permease [Acetobacteraceae bacterium]
MFRNFGANEILMLAAGLQWTAGLTALAFAGSILLGLLLLVLRTGRFRFLRWSAALWIQAVQGVPLLGHIVLVFFGLALFEIDVPRWLAATVALSIYGSAFLSEIWRGAVEAIPRGQWEAAGALGLRRRHQLRLVVLPQAFTIAIPPTVGFLVQLIKNTSLASVIGLVELSREAQLVNGATFAPFAVYSCTSLLYFALCFPLTTLSRRLESRRAARTA